MLPLPTTVLHQTTHKINAAAGSTEADETKTDAVAPLEFGRILSQERVGCNDASNIAETDLPG
jgi:hypothetical protein